LYLTNIKINSILITAATAHDDKYSSLLRTVKYEIFTNIYTTNTNSTDVMIHSGRFLKSHECNVKIVVVHTYLYTVDGFPTGTHTLITLKE
jgi:hypothetical protein